MKAQTPPFFWASAMRVQRERRLAGGFRAVDLDDPAARQAADAERDVEAERAGRDGLDLDRLLALAEPHDRAFAEGALDLRQRRVERLRLVLVQLDEPSTNLSADDDMRANPYGMRQGKKQA